VCVRVCVCVCVCVCVSLQYEDASLDMFNHLVEENKLVPVMEKHGLVMPEDLKFIKEQISGHPESSDSPKGGVCAFKNLLPTID